MNAKYLTIICLIVIHCQTAKSNDPPEEDRKGKSIVVASTSEQEAKQKEIEELLKKVEEREEDIWKIVEIKKEGQSEGYTTKDTLLKVLPDQPDKIVNWLNENPGSDEDGTFIIKKPRFRALLQNLEPNPENEQKRMIEVKKLWKKIQVKDIDESEVKRPNYTTRTEVIKVLPKYTDEIFGWIENDGGLFEITKDKFQDLMRYIPISLEALIALNEHLAENPSTFLD
ncbi:uncharacterized protein LOC126843523 [Adelges cooleyi]|uniref:uncharacterized protein LOC126843523 n=1 Tax=Adelges cooleyi TaxID=133065 RepID=UPI0021805639|nr:uncharacterized protein LOC126843523 [Adelges cooleyi]